MAVFEAVFHGDETFSATFDGTQTFGATFNTVVEVMGDVYSGSMEWTPTKETQTIPVDGLNMAGNITINPIPNNYALVEYDGSMIRFS